MSDQQRVILEPTTRAFIDAVNAQKGKPLHELPYADARKLLEELQAKDVHKLPADIEERTLPVGPTGEVPIRI
ncbi:MAG TPA: hypothetical protein VFP40_12540 [Terriglobales bacterium]|nr:hypothetical protein [Terriglobales bacterium]